ncbi:hypothetical protein H6G97_45925 [Nostoc flagelliforme FACHB-838]|uniref:Uncharacterized protein n=1 Tax=Nostoc flagelliforme FACHB-838 TaxID=2692904 RepID=A0ABR8E3G8_9NOSO|nr:hypothetical protein [Nostoc flagelliforme FACHB-838]
MITHQSIKLQKVDNQAVAQAELDNYIADQAQVVAPEPLTIVEISFDHHEYYADDKLVASISYDDNHLTQRWVVMVNDKEVFRANTVMRCHRFICTHYKDGTLPVQEEAEVQGSRGAEGKNLQQLSPLPLCASAPTPSSSTENQIMAHIFNECQSYGFEILDDGIYNNGVKLGQVGCTDRNWWVKRSYSSQQQYSNSVFDAVRSLSMLDTVPHAEAPDCEELLDRPCEMLTALDWEMLREYAPVTESRELVAA